MTQELTRAKIVARLEREGWAKEGGSKHEKFGNAAKPGIKIMVPRHKTLTPGVARNIAKAAGWTA
jgi:predicted RNA binding protein YcfA (HicA-like mRNA interferase family)